MSSPEPSTPKPPSMLRQLRLYYDEQGIGAADFHCKHRDACSAGHPDFVQAKEAYVGSGYERHELPRLLFVSLDAGSSDSLSDRSLEGVREGEKNMEVQKLKKGQHWYRTHEMARCFLKRFRSELSVSEARDYFAHTNSAKCCTNNPHHRQAAGILFLNCREFIGGEVLRLKPDILITQGAKAREAILAAATILPAVDAVDPVGRAYRALLVEGRSVPWFHTYHPRYFGGFNQQRRNDFETWADIAAKVVRWPLGRMSS